ncbi:MAG: YhjD/YihY/BrkB family envelope integrity protein [Microbacterium sp.]
MSTDPHATDTDRHGARPPASAPFVRWALELRPVRAVLLYIERHGPMLADAITYRALFSVFAGIALGFSLAALWLADHPVAWKAVVDAVSTTVPGLIGEQGVVKTEDLRQPISLSIAGAISLAGLVAAALGAISSLQTAVRLIAGTTHDDVLWVWVIVRNLALAIAIAASVVVSAVLTIAGRFGIARLTGLLGLDEHSPVAAFSIRAVSLIVVFLIDTALIAVIFVLLSGVRTAVRTLLGGAALGGAGLLVLQELSNLFVGGAWNNPLLASFATLVAVLIWLNLSAQVILLSCAYIVTPAGYPSQDAAALSAPSTPRAAEDPHQ